MDGTSDQHQGTRRRLVLCFDGTGNKFQGNESDTNIVKLYELLERHDPNQFHYYQPGIGSYVEHQASNSSHGSLWTRIKSKIVTTIDQAVGTSFVYHVLAGYRFIMRYYNEGDLIYIFGFSRGAYTARFLAEMLFSIGLLSRGNEEMVQFAWDTFSDFQRSRGNVHQSKRDQKNVEYMKKFKDTFCRDMGVYFLGLFDCVNSVGQFEILMFRKSYNHVATPPAKYIRHAVSIHERRLKFKPALFLMDDATPVPGVNTDISDVKEVWFAGQHGDVGGGWMLAEHQRHLLSDTPLEWMLQEVKTVPDADQLAFRKQPVVQDIVHATEDGLGLVRSLRHGELSNHELRVLTNQPHDMLAFNRGATWFATLQWWILEVLPLTRLELEDGKWVPRYWPPNLGRRRDIPNHAAIHPSVDAMHRAGVLSQEQMPKLGGEEGLNQMARPLTVLSTWERQRKDREEAGRSKQRDQKDSEITVEPTVNHWDGDSA